MFLVNNMTIRLSNLTTEQLTEWLEIIQKYPDNVTHWDAKQQPKPVLREARTYDGDALYSTVSEEEVEDEESVEEPVIEGQDVVVKITDPDAPFQPKALTWYEFDEDKLVYPDSEDTSATQPLEPEEKRWYDPSSPDYLETT